MLLYNKYKIMDSNSPDISYEENGQSKVLASEFVTDKEGVYVYSLSDFTAKEGIRDTTDIIEKYRKGILGAIPEPELINTLLDLKGNAKGVDQSDK
ncbi:MAG: hypothetical protein RSE61_07070 [Anaerovoracaceae bacterium]